MTHSAPRASPRDFLAGLELFGIKLGLESIQALCEALGHPERSFPSLLIAGTNGKGSVAAITAEALRAAGLRVGRYTSPHLIRLEERFHIDSSAVTASALDEALDRVREVVSELQAKGRMDVHPTYFEVTTAAAFCLFAWEAVDVAVVEVGLGGRFDATNVVMPVVSCITTIAHDHQQHLGSSLADIAREKAGIIKPGVPVVIGDLPREALAVVSVTSQERGAALIEAFTGTVVTTTIDDGTSVISLTTPERRYEAVPLGLRGEHQVHNAVVAVRLLETVSALGLSVPADAVCRGLKDVRWAARLDLRVLKDGRRVLIDGAHNPAGAAALSRYMRGQWPGGLPIVFGAMSDKDLPGMLAPLASLARPLVLTTVPVRRSATTRDLAAAAEAVGIRAPVVEPDVDEALARAWSVGHTIAVAGSLYLAGAVLERIERD